MIQDAVTVETVGYRAFDFARAFVAEEPDALHTPAPEFLRRLEFWAFDPFPYAQHQALVASDRRDLVKRIQAALSPDVG